MLKWDMVKLKKKKVIFFLPWPMLAQTRRKRKLFSLKICVTALLLFQPTYAWYRHIQMHMKKFLFLLMRMMPCFGN